MTLEQAVPGLRNSPAGPIFAIADNIFDLTGPGNGAAVEILNDQSQQVIREIKAIDPTWHYEGLGPVETVEGNINKLNELRFTRAAVLLRVRQDIGPLQVETLRFIQERTDKAYDRGVELLRTGKLKIRLSEQEALGNYIDREVRGELRERYNQAGIDSAAKGPVRVNRREDDSSGTDLTYRRPDARAGNIAYDVTLTRKTLQTPQVRGFFNADFRPSSVVIIRPRQLGAESSYVISRPETKR
ncbi:hypothetical protein ASG11_17720 [Sphingomonas sp. Leaf357]|uniref:hypothetical protein n=1 Tax=Sphingomonas sp. Leaf357 TaxID=1736350 RepID=UPI0006F515FC|nr:hypothetical protein [Sphingomonas sp. Leaf357]KQS01492.1 hypothetical protein ASG11_17720 [Sphingomonas sp. Leaf357]